MKNFIQKTILLLLISSHGFLKAQGELTPGIQTSSLNASIDNWVNSTSDKNKTYYASAYWVAGVDCANYLKIYNGTTFAATSPQVRISNHHGFTRVKLDDNNNVYVLYVDKSSTGKYNTYLKKYSPSGTLIGSRIKVADNNKATDIVVAPNGDVLIGSTNDNKVFVRIYRNMNYKGFMREIGTISNITNSSPFSLQMDMKGSKLVIGYSYGKLSASKMHIKRYTYVPKFIASLNYATQLYSNYSESGSRFITRNTNQIALRTNWEVFYNVSTATSYPFTDYKVKYLNSGGSSIFQHSRGFVDADINNRLLISKDYGTPADGNFTTKLFDANNNLLHEFLINTKIKNDLESIAIYDCEFIVTGIDRKLGANPNLHTYQSFHQVFNCKDCRPNMGATAVAKFKYPYQVNQYPSRYGPIDVTELCLVDDLLIDGSLSSCEDRYFVGLAEFNPINWTDTVKLHSDWVRPLTEAPNNINIVDFLPPGYHLRPGKIYRFKLAVGNPWHSVEVFFEVTCCKRKIIIDDQHQEKGNYDYTLTFEDKDIESTEEQKVNFTTYPNPVKDKLVLDFSKFNSKKDKNLSIKNVQGNEMYTANFKTPKETINVSKWPPGLYICNLTIDGKAYQNKIIKK